MPTRMPDQRHQQDLVAAAGQGADAVEAEPALALRLVDLPFGAMGEMRRAVARLLAEAGPVHRGVVLGGEDMHLGIREVGQAAGMVQVQVGHHDMTHVGGLEAECLHLMQRRLLHAQCRPRQRAEAGAEMARVAHVGAAQAGVDQHQAVGALDQQAVAAHLRRFEQAAGAVDQLLAVRAHGAAVEVMDLEGHELSRIP